MDGVLVAAVVSGFVAAAVALGLTARKSDVCGRGVSINFSKYKDRELRNRDEGNR